MDEEIKECKKEDALNERADRIFDLIDELSKLAAVNSKRTEGHWKSMFWDVLFSQHTGEYEVCAVEWKEKTTGEIFTMGTSDDVPPEELLIQNLGRVLGRGQGTWGKTEWMLYLEDCIKTRREAMDNNEDPAIEIKCYPKNVSTDPIEFLTGILCDWLSTYEHVNDEKCRDIMKSVVSYIENNMPFGITEFVTRG